MKAWRTVRESLGLLTKRDRRLLLVVVLLQSMLSILDVVAIALIGIIAASAAGAVPGQFAKILDYIQTDLGISTASPSSLAIAIGAFAGALLVAKSLVSFVITRRVFSFLERRQAVISGSFAERLLRRPLLA